MNGLKHPTVAVLGTGSAGMKHVDAFRRAGARVIGVPIRPGRDSELRAQGIEATASLADAAAQGASAAVIATDTGRHADDACAALALGLNVLVEKPLAADPASARRVVEAARGRRAATGCVLRFCRSLQEFRARVPSLGRVTQVEIECRSYLPDWRPGRAYRDSYSARAAEGGVMRDLIHEIDYAGWLFGWPDAVAGQLINRGTLGIDSEEEAELSWTTPSGCRVGVGLDYISKIPRRRMLARGERGTLEWDGIAHGDEAETWFEAQARAFLADEPSHLSATLEEGLRSVEICDAVRRSSQNGRPEAVR